MVKNHVQENVHLLVHFNVYQSTTSQRDSTCTLTIWC